MPESAVENALLQFRFIGSGILKNSILRTIKSLGLEHKIKVTSVIHKDIPRMLTKNVDIVVHPTLLNETLGFSNIEAMAAGIPVVTYGVGGVAEYLSHANGNGVYGVVVDTPTPDAMASAIWELITDKGMRKSMSVAARNFITSNSSLFKKSLTINRYMSICRQMLCKKKRERPKQ